MIKKIIIGIIITAVLSLGAAGSIYAIQKEQPKSNTTALTADGKNNSNVSSVENKYQYGNAYSKTEKNGNCESENNRYSWQHNYNRKNENCDADNCLEYNYNYKHNYTYQNSNIEDKSNTFCNQNQTANNNECKNTRSNGNNGR